MKSYKTLCTVSASLIALSFLAQAQEPAGNTKKDETGVVVVSKTEKDEAVVSMSFDETPISDVIRAFRDATGANIISSGTNLANVVSVRLDNVTWRKGLSSILDPQGLQLVEKPAGSGIYIVETVTIDVPTITRTFKLDNAQVADVEELFTAVLGENGTATAFPAANTLIVTAPEKEINECEMIIEAIDAPVQQVYIEARFVEMSAAAGKSLGIRWDSLDGDGWGFSFDGATLGYNNSKATVRNKGSDLRTPDGTQTINPDGSVTIVPPINSTPVSYNYSTGSDTYNRNRTFSGSLSADAFKIAVNAFESTDGVSVFSNPKVIVANEQKAKIDMTTKEPNVEVDYQAATTEGQRDSVSTKLGIIPGEEEPFVGEAFFSYGITLNVKPRISSSGLVTVTIEPSISERVGYFEVAGLDPNMPIGKFPIIDMRRIQTVFTMESGRTAVIGGLSRTSDRSTESGIPFLKNIPWIGPRLFGWKGRQKSQKEIVIFVTVKIADPTTLKEEDGIPQNAILSKEVITGELKTPSDMTRADLFNLKSKGNVPEKKRFWQKEKDAEKEEPIKEIPEKKVTETITKKEAPKKVASVATSPKKAPVVVTEKEAAKKAPEPILAN